MGVPLDRVAVDAATASVVVGHLVVGVVVPVEPVAVDAATSVELGAAMRAPVAETRTAAGRADDDLRLAAMR